MSLGDNIRKARIKNQLSQKELTEKLAKKNIVVRDTTISNWENGISKPDPDTILQICNILNVDANYLLDFNSQKNKNNILNNTKYKKILQEKGLMDENENINEEKMDDLLKIADMMKNFNKGEND